MKNPKENKENQIKLMSGIFFIVGIVLFIGFVFMIGKDRGFIQPKFKILVLFHNVGGLTEGAPTLLAGVNVGRVESIDFLDKDIDGRRVQVTLSILSKHKKQFQKNLLCVIKTEGVLGEKIVEITVDEKAGAADLSKPILGQDPLDVQDVAESFAGAAKAFTKTSEALGQIDMVELSQIMKESSEALLVTANGINSVMDDLQEITIKAKRLMERLEEKVIEGNLFKVF
jgi:ABC-type transporter Mla subunit MlaD